MNKIHLIFFLLSIQCNLFSQQHSRAEYTVGIGASVYFGDMDSGDLISDLLYLSPSIQFRYKYKHNGFFNTDVNLLIGRLKGDDNRSTSRQRVGRNLNFFSPLYELSVIEEIHPFGTAKMKGKTILTPYLMTGVGAFYFNPKTKDNNGTTYELQPLGTEGQGAPGYDDKYSRLKICIPFGGGLKYKINEKYGISLEVMSRYTFTDYIDDLSTDYVPQQILLNNGGPKAVELSDRRDSPRYSGIRGDKENIDYYFTYVINFHVHLFQDRLSLIKNPKVF